MRRSNWAVQRIHLAMVKRELRIEDGHQMFGRVVFKVPECGNNGFGAGLNECVDEVGNIGFAGRPDAGVAGRKGDKIRIQMERPDFAHLQ